MKLKHPLDEDTRLELEKFVSEAKTTLELEKSRVGKKEKMQELRSKLEKDVRDLSKRFDGRDEDVLAEITAKRQQLDLLPADSNEREDPRLPLARAQNEARTWTEPMTRASAVIRPLLRTAIDEWSAETYSMLRPLYSSDLDAKNAVANTEAAQAAWRFITHGLGDITSPRGSAIRLMNIAEKLLAEEDFWSFNRDPKK